MVVADCFIPQEGGAFYLEQERCSLVRQAGVAAQCPELLPDFVEDFQDSSEAVRRNRSLVALAVSIVPELLGDCEEPVRNDAEVVLSAVSRDGEALRFLREAWRGDRDLVLRAMQSNGLGLQYASEELRNDLEVVTEAVRSDGRALQYAGERLRADRSIVLLAVKSVPAAIEHAAEAIRTDPEIFTAALWHQRHPEEPARAKARAEDGWEYFRQVADSAVAIPGESAPVVSIRSVFGDDSGDAEHQLRIEATLLSGLTFNYKFATSACLGSSWGPPTVNDLAMQLLKDLSRSTEVEEVQSVFLSYERDRDDDDDDNPGDDFVRAWDWSRPLSEFFQRSSTA